MTRCITLPYVCNMTGRASSIPIALWATQLEIEPGALDKWPRLLFRPVAGAYVAVVQAGTNGPFDAACEILYGRTNEVGWVVRRALHELGESQDIPPQPYEVAAPKQDWFMHADDPVRFHAPAGQCADPTVIACLPGERLRIFWCYDRDSFFRFESLLRTNREAALEEWGARAYTVEPFGEPASLAGLDLLPDKPVDPARPEHTARRVVARLLFAGDRQGYHSGEYVDAYRTAAVFDATPASFRALFLAEWLEWYTARLRADQDWAALITALHVSSIAQQRGPVVEFDRQIHALTLGEIRAASAQGHEPPRDYTVFEAYRQYAHDCAKVYARLVSGDEREALRKRFHDAILVTRSDSAWRVVANQLRAKHELVHPWHSGKYSDADLHLEFADEREPFVAYFDYYAAGLCYQTSGLVDRIHGAWISADEAFGWIAQKRRQLLREPSYSRHDALARDISLCTPPGQLGAPTLLDRHARQCATVGFPWWVEAEETYFGTQDKWEAFVAKLGWLSNHVNGVGDILGGFVQSYASLYAHTPETARAAVRLCLRYERWLKTGVTEDIVLPGRSAHWSYRRSGKTFSFSLELGKRRLHVGSYTLQEHTDVRRTNVTGPLGEIREVTSRNVTELELAKTLKRSPASLALDPDVIERLEGGAGVISTLGALLDVGLALQALARAPDVGSWDWFTSEPAQLATWSVLQGVESCPQFLQAARKGLGLAPLSLRALGWIGGAGVLFEGSATLVAGYKAVYAEDGALANAFDRGEQTSATYELAAGVAQLVMGAGGVVAGLAGIAGLSLVAGPFGLLFGLGSLAVAVTQAAIYLRSGEHNRVQPLLDRVAAAEQREFHLDERGRATSREQQPVRLRQRLGLLNHALNGVKLQR